MEFNLSIRRLVVLLILLMAFWALGGFSPPIVPDSAYQSTARVQKAWTYCLILYLTGAGCATIVDHFVGNLDRSNLRLLYIILGTLLMISSLLWLHVIHDGIKIGN